MSTVTPGLGWSGIGGIGSVENRTAGDVEKVAVLGLRIETVIVWPSNCKVADEPFVVTVAFVCMRHCIGPCEVISSWTNTCCRLFKKRTPRLTEVLIEKLSSEDVFKSQLTHRHRHCLYQRPRTQSNHWGHRTRYLILGWYWNFQS